MLTDPAFLAFFDGEFQRRLAAAQIPGMPTASWDRRAAWLLWQAEGHATLPAPPWTPPVSTAPVPPSFADFMKGKA